MLNEVITAIVETSGGVDSDGFPVESVKVEHTLFCTRRDAGVMENYEAQRNGIKVDAIFSCDTDSLKDLTTPLPDGTKARPTLIVYEDETYRITSVRVTKSDDNLTEIVCERVGI